MIPERNHDATAQRLTSAHPLSFLFWSEGRGCFNASMLQCFNIIAWNRRFSGANAWMWIHFSNQQS